LNQLALFKPETIPLVDESDPLWKAVLKLANGDRAKALKMLNHPDQLEGNPEIEKILAETDPNRDKTDEIIIAEDALISPASSASSGFGLFLSSSNRSSSSRIPRFLLGRLVLFVVVRRRC
jgi:hypothetical protein